jgi:hypothetical protein
MIYGPSNEGVYTINNNKAPLHFRFCFEYSNLFSVVFNVVGIK